MSQSIDLSAVTDATFNGVSLDAINLNGLEIWVGGPLNCNGIFQWSLQVATTAQTGMGMSVATQGDYIAVSETSYGGASVGRTHIYNTSGTLLRYITNPLENNYWFGTVISIKDNYVYLYSNLYVFKYDMSTGQEVWRTVLGDSSSGGWNVFASDDYLVACQTNTSSPYNGQIRFFDLDTGAYSHLINVSLNANEMLYRLAISKDSTRIAITLSGSGGRRVKFINATNGTEIGSLLTGTGQFLGWNPKWNEKHQFFTFPSAGDDIQTHIYSKDGAHIRTINMSELNNSNLNTSGDYIYISAINSAVEKVFAYNYVTNSVTYTLNSTHAVCQWGNAIAISESGRLVVTSHTFDAPYDLNFIDVYE